MSCSTSNSRWLNGSIRGWAGTAGGRYDVVFARLLLSFKCSQQRADIVRHHPMRSGFGQQLRHRQPFVDKETDEAARLCQRQRVTQQLHSLVLFAVRVESDRLEHHHLEPFIRPTLCLRLLAQWLQHRQCCGRVALGQVYPRLAEGEVVRLRQMSGRRQIALAKQRQHLCGSNLRHPMHEVMLARERFGLSQNSGRAGHISLGKFQAGEKHLTGSEGVDAFHLPRQLEALLPVLLGGIQVVPFVEIRARPRCASQAIGCGGSPANCRTRR